MTKRERKTQRKMGRFKKDKKTQEQQEQGRSGAEPRNDLSDDDDMEYVPTREETM